MGGLTTTCIVIAPPGTSPTGTLDCETVLLFSRILPALINLISLIDFGCPGVPIEDKEGGKKASQKVGEGNQGL